MKHNSRYSSEICNKKYPRISELPKLEECKDEFLFLSEELRQKVYQIAVLILYCRPSDLVTILPDKFVDIDSLQMAFALNGYKKGFIGEGASWYRNILSNATGYIAELEAISPDGITVRAIINTMSLENPKIEGIRIVLEPNNLNDFIKRYPHLLYRQFDSHVKTALDSMLTSENRIFYLLTGEDVDHVLEEMELKLSQEDKKSLFDYLESNFSLPWFEELEAYIETWEEKQRKTSSYS